MSDLLVIAYRTEPRAEEMHNRLPGMQKEYLIDLGYAVVAVTQPNGQMKLNQLFSPAAASAAPAA
ncbi:MAG: hypothetical protein IRY87_21570 [Acetobacteraceae bacterium]|nr:hypothetical protein [Acetobacteraceae bacterium]